MDLAGLIDNQSLLVARPFVLMDQHGRDVIVVVAKASFRVPGSGAPITFADPPAPVRVTAIASDARDTSDRYPSDAVGAKPGTDIMMVGTAHPPQRGATHVDVSLRVGAIDKKVRVWGPRVWQRTMSGVTPGPAAALTPTPLSYELAYGGADGSVVEWRNPAGLGVAANRQRLVGEPAPQIEDLRAPLDGRHPAPAGFGPIRPDWEPRAGFAGTADEAWRRARAPVPPIDFDLRHHCAGPADLWSREPLVGGEDVVVAGVTPTGAWRFRIPRYTALFEARYVDRTVPCPTHLDTLLLDADALHIELAWRTVVPLPRRGAELRAFVVRAQAGDEMRDIAGHTLARAVAHMR